MNNEQSNSDSGDQQELVNRSVTSVSGVSVGHAVSEERPTGCTVVILPRGTVGAVDVRGGAPGSREQALLDPTATLQEVDAFVLSGGSAFGLDSVAGVMKCLESQGRGFLTPQGVVPIVPAAVIYDLGYGNRPAVRPDAKMGHDAAESATSQPVANGSVGAGIGATVGKLLGPSRAMRGGLGSSAELLADGTIVAALVVVNAVGNVSDLRGEAIAGCMSQDRTEILDAASVLRSAEYQPALTNSNTTVAVVVTNAKLSKVEATKIAQMSHDGLARAIDPVHTPFDGDTVFVAATRSHQQKADMLVIGSTAAQVLRSAVIAAVKNADPYRDPSIASDLEG